MTLVLYKALAALIIFLISIAAVIYPLRTKEYLQHAETFELGEAFASGIFLGVAFFHMLPSSIATFQQLYPTIAYPIPEAICIAGFLLLLFLERLSLAHTIFKPEHTIPYILTIILIIHALTEGAALGIGNFAEAFVIFIAIIAHKGSASFALCVTLMRYKLPRLSIIFLILLFSLMTPIGIGFGTILNNLTQVGRGALVEAIFNAFAAGTFIYISTLHHINFHKRLEEDTQGMGEFACLALGLVTMAIIAVWF